MTAVTILIAIASGLCGSTASAWFGFRLARRNRLPSASAEVMPVNADVVRLLNDQVARVAGNPDVLSPLIANALLEREALRAHLLRNRPRRGDAR